MKLATREWGDGPRTVAIVHGINGSAALWNSFASLLVERHDVRVIAVDLRGHGSSPRDTSYLLDDFVGDLTDTLQHAPDILLGHSLGGRIVHAAVPLLRPERAIYIDPGFSVSLPGFVQRAPGLNALLGRTLAISAPGVPLADRPTKRETTRQWHRWMSRQIVLDMAARPVPIAPPAVPSTVLLSHRSPLVPARYAARLRGVGWVIHTLDRAKHDMYLLEPARTLDALDGFLRVADEPSG